MKRYALNFTVLAFFFLALGLEAMAGCGCGQQGRHYHGSNYQGYHNQSYYNNQGYYSNQNYYHNQANYQGVHRPTFNSQVGVPIRWVKPVIVNPGYGYHNGYGYSNQGYANGHYNGYGYNTYNIYQQNRGCSPQRGYYRGW